MKIKQVGYGNLGLNIALEQMECNACHSWDDFYWGDPVKNSIVLKCRKCNSVYVLEVRLKDREEFRKELEVA